MAKAKRILTFITAVMMLFTVTLAFAGCKDEEEEKITYMIYVSDRQLTGLTNVTDAAIMEGVQLVCELKDGAAAPLKSIGKPVLLTWKKSAKSTERNPMSIPRWWPARTPNSTAKPKTAG